MHDVTRKKNYQNVCICRDNYLNEDGYLYQDLKSVGKEIKKTPRVSYKLTLFHLSWIWVECLVDNTSFEERPFGSVDTL